MYRNEVKIIAITYFLANLAILDTKIAITRYLVLETSFRVYEVWFKQNSRNIIFTTISLLFILKSL